MSVSKWAWTGTCEGAVCCEDCGLCAEADREDDIEAAAEARENATLIAERMDKNENLH